MVALPDPQPTIGDGLVELAPFDEDDASVLVAWDRDPEMARWFDWSLVRVSDPHSPLGSAELTFADPSRADVSYSTIAAYRRHGIASRALRLLAAWGLGLGVPEIRLTADAANVASIAVARSAGFELDTVDPGGIAYEAYEPWIGQRHDAEVWVLRGRSP